MSHVAKVELDIKNLDDLEAAATAVGLELVRDVTQYHWYGTNRGGRNAGGQLVDASCAHVLRVPNTGQEHYEVGVVQRADGRGFELVYDNWGPGARLDQLAGPGLVNLRREYAALTSARALRTAGWSVTRRVNAQGEIVIEGAKF